MNVIRSRDNAPYFEGQMFRTPGGLVQNDPATGATQDCVPWYGHGNQPADPAWGSAYTFLADWVQTYFDDVSMQEICKDLAREFNANDPPPPKVRPSVPSFVG